VIIFFHALVLCIPSNMDAGNCSLSLLCSRADGEIGAREIGRFLCTPSILSSITLVMFQLEFFLMWKWPSNIEIWELSAFTGESTESIRSDAVLF